MNIKTIIPQIYQRCCQPMVSTSVQIINNKAIIFSELTDFFTETLPYTTTKSKNFAVMGMTTIITTKIQACDLSELERIDLFVEYPPFFALLQPYGKPLLPALPPLNEYADEY